MPDAPASELASTGDGFLPRGWAADLTKRIQTEEGDCGVYPIAVAVREEQIDFLRYNIPRIDRAIEDGVLVYGDTRIPIEGAPSAARVVEYQREVNIAEAGDVFPGIPILRSLLAVLDKDGVSLGSICLGPEKDFSTLQMTSHDEAMRAFGLRQFRPIIEGDVERLFSLGPTYFGPQSELAKRYPNSLFVGFPHLVPIEMQQQIISLGEQYGSDKLFLSQMIDFIGSNPLGVPALFACLLKEEAQNIMAFAAKHPKESSELFQNWAGFLRDIETLTPEGVQPW